jgi:XTP/dITP diphosphohydrolase
VKLFFATRNAGKLRELRDLVGSLFEIRSLDDFPDLPEVEEKEETFEGNARLKALACAKATGMAALADDSGLCVDALDGRPGVRSARYAPGPDAARIEKLLAEMADVPEPKRGAAFQCALCLALPDGSSATESAQCRGQIARLPRGSHGFGYDPIFLVPELGKTMAELAPEEKARISHRARAWGRMLPHLKFLKISGGISP